MTGLAERVAPVAVPQGEVFIDQFGSEHRPIPGYRSTVKPGWERMFSQSDKAARSSADIRAELEEVASRVRLGVRMLEIVGCALRGSKVLNIGCDSGEESLYLAAHGASEVIGTNHTQLRDATGGNRAPLRPVHERDEKTKHLFKQHLRELALLDPFERGGVSFVQDDISASAFDDGSFDFVCSWRTLEHLVDPYRSFAEMHRILRPGGCAYHEYNPFFAVDGGHSLCTLDFPWGHARLARCDVERYLAGFRPAEQRMAMDYYHHGLNRLTIKETMQGLCDAGFEVLTLLPRARTEDVLEMTSRIHDQVRAVYPQVTLQDLVCRVVRVVLRRH